jgi:site-specific DNA-methyltransferase (adenine-specific)
VKETNKVYHQDCIAGMREMVTAGQQVDCVITDPPYLINYKTNMRDYEHKFKHAILGDSDPELIREYFDLCYKLLKQDKALFTFCDIDKIDVFKQFLVDAGFTLRSTIIWWKGGGGMGDLKTTFAPDYEVIIHANKGTAEILGKRYGSVWVTNKIHQSDLLHQNQKPLDLMYKLIRAHTVEGDLILDGFMGSFTTAVACHKTQRKFVGFELDPYYYQVGMDRMKAETMQVSMFDMVSYDGVDCATSDETNLPSNLPKD